MDPKDAEGMANSIDPDQTAPELLLEEQSDLGLHCLSRFVCPNIQDHYGIWHSKLVLYILF